MHSQDHATSPTTILRWRFLESRADERVYHTGMKPKTRIVGRKRTWAAPEPQEIWKQPFAGP
jgi:hypothetical protein